MRPRNEGLHAEIERVVDLKVQIPSCKTIAAKHAVSVETVRSLIFRERKAREVTNVNIHSAPIGEKMRG